MSAYLSDLPVRSARIVDLNLIRVRLATNLEEFAAYSYFDRFSADSEDADYEVCCIDLDRDELDPGTLASIASSVDKSYRGKRFKAGYYLVHYFGDPAYLISTGHAFYVFGRHLEKTVWPYFVKHILTIFAADHGYLHLKAAGFVQPGVGATLLAGRNSGGKTVFLTQACLHGARFLTNTHALIRDGVVHGVPSSMRVRADECFRDLIGEHGLTEHMESGDYVTSPRTLFGDATTDSAPLRNVVIVDYSPAGRAGIEEISAAAAEAFLDQFAFAVTTYGLKDDLFAHYGYDFDGFTGGLAAMKDQLGELTRLARCFRANVDMLSPADRAATLSVLAATQPVAR